MTATTYPYQQPSLFDEIIDQIGRDLRSAEKVVQKGIEKAKGYQQQAMQAAALRGSILNQLMRESAQAARNNLAQSLAQKSSDFTDLASTNWAKQKGRDLAERLGETLGDLSSRLPKDIRPLEAVKNGLGKGLGMLSDGFGLAGKGLGLLGKGVGLLGSIGLIFDFATAISEIATLTDEKLEEFMGLNSPPYADAGEFMPEPGEASQSSTEVDTSPAIPPVIRNPRWMTINYTISRRWEIYTYSNLRENTRYFAFWGEYPILSDIFGYRDSFNLRYRILTDSQYVFINWEVGERIFVPIGQPGAGRYIGASRIGSIGFIALGWVNLDTGESETYDEPTLVRIAWNRNLSTHGWGGSYGEPVMEVMEQTGAIWGTYDRSRISPQFFPGAAGIATETSESYDDMTCPNIRPLLLQHQAQIRQQISTLSQTINTTNVSSAISQSQGTIVNAISQSQAATVADLADIKSRIGAQIPGGISGGVTGTLERLGPQIKGGLSGAAAMVQSSVESLSAAFNAFFQAFNKFKEWIAFDRVLNVLILVSTIHNGYLLSRNLGETLISMFNNILTAAGNALGLRDVDDQPIDIGPIIGSTIENIIKGLVGAETLDGIKTGWKKYSAILNAAALLMYTVQSLNQSIISALEIVGSNVAKIGNALKKWGEVSERAFGWMNISPNFNNPFFSLVERTEDRVSQIDMVAGEFVSSQEQVKQVGEMMESLQKSIAEVEGGKAGKESPEATKVKAKEDASKSASQASAEIPYRSE